MKKRVQNRRGHKQALEPERIHKLLSRLGIASRRTIEQWIREERITVNRKKATIGQAVTPRDHICLDGKRLRLSNKTEPRARVIMYYKPEGEVCSMRDPEGRPSVFDKLPRLRSGRWVMVGRLDINSSGLLLFTTDGDLAHKLMHPSYGIAREYAVRVLGDLNADKIKQLQTGVVLEDGPAKFENIVRYGGEGANVWYHVLLREGRTREVRRMFDAVGTKVSRLIRFRYGPINMPRDFHLGERRYLTPEQIQTLKREVSKKPR